MAKKHSKHPRDANQLAKRIVDIATRNEPSPSAKKPPAQKPTPKPGKDIWIYQNLIGRHLSGLSFAGKRDDQEGTQAYIFRNILNIFPFIFNRLTILFLPASTY